jgi:hypothetical protein
MSPGCSVPLFAGTVVEGLAAPRVRTAEGEITVAEVEPGDTFFMVDRAR